MTHFPGFATLDLTQFPEQLDLQLNNHLKTIHALLETKQAWTWDNLIQPLETMDDAIEQLWAPLSHMHAVVNTPQLRDCYQACLPKLSTYESTIGHNHALYEAIKAIPLESLNKTQQKIIHDMLRNFKLSGVSLPLEDKTRLEEIHERLAKCTNQFENNILDVENQYEYLITDENRLQGIPPHTKYTALESAKEKNQEGWCLTLAYPCVQGVLTYAEDRNLRETLYHAYVTRASDLGPHEKQFDNTDVMEEILSLRHEEAKLIGFHHYAEYSLATKMAKNSELVLDFLFDLNHRAQHQAKDEYHALQTYAQEHCGLDTLEPWDIAYVSQKKKQALFSLTDETLRPYFPLPHVMNGLLYILKALYGVTFEKMTDKTLDTWHHEVDCYRIIDEQNNTRGYLYLDLFARPNKRGGAWMDSLQSRRQLEDGSIQLPIATLTCNFARPLADKSPTLSHDEVVTLFHEFGHCLHHLLTTVDYVSAAGIHGVEWDAVELPSQFFENWCWAEESLQKLSAHEDTGAPIPKHLFEQLLSSKNFLSAMGLVRQVEFSLFDFKLHQMYEPNTPHFVANTLADVRKVTSVVPIASYNRFQHGFSHIFAGGYAAGYYSYLWAEVLSSDAFARFEEEGLFDAKAGRDFLHCILEVGSSRRAEESFQCFRGRKPVIDALLKDRGIGAQHADK